VQAVVVHRETVPVRVLGYGDVRPATRIELVPQVSGKVASIHPSMVEGGFVEPDTVLIQLERDDYEIALKQAEASVRQAEGAVASAKSAVLQADSGIEEAQAAIQQAQTRLATEKAEAASALREWRTLHAAEPPPPLLVREPQIREAEAALQSAKARKLAAEAQKVASESQKIAAEAEVVSAQARLRRAELDLKRTALAVPFRGRVLSESVDVGQYVVAGQPLATVYGTDIAEIVMPVSDDKLQWIELSLKPDVVSESAVTAVGNVSAEVTARFAGETITWRLKAASASSASLRLPATTASMKSA